MIPGSMPLKGFQGMVDFKQAQQLRPIFMR